MTIKIAQSTLTDRSHKTDAVASTVVILLLGLLATAGFAQPLYTSYQGVLNEDGTPLDGTADFKFVIVDSSGSSVWSNDGTSTGGGAPTSSVSVTVTSGVFTVLLGDTPMDPLPAESLFDLNQASLRVWVDTGGGFEQLDDQALASAPFSISSESAKRSYGEFAADGIIESTVGGFKFPDGSVQTTAIGATGSFWSLEGNSGTIPGVNFLGTTDEQDLRIKVNSHLTMRFQTTGDDIDGDHNTPNVVGGRGANAVTSGAYGATISGGGAKNAEENKVTDNFGSIGGGKNNRAGDNNGVTDDATFATVSGGSGNQAAGGYATVGGGSGNVATNFSTVAGGQDNEAAGSHATIGGGFANNVLGASSTIGGGHQNQATGEKITISGGFNNIATGWFSMIGGGYQNSVGGPYAVAAGGLQNLADGEGAFAAGGYDNKALGDYSFAAGHKSRALAEGSFVWTDRSSTNNTYVSNGVNTFNIRADGGVHIADSANNERIKLLPSSGTIRTEILEITGGMDVAEPFAINSPTPLPPGSVVVIDSEEPGQLKISNRAYDRRVAGVISGAGGINPGMTLRQHSSPDGGQCVALTGRVYVRADADPGAIQPGDLLTTSSLTGHAMKASDRDRANGAVLGKAMSPLNEGQGLILVLVNLQ